jgi:hypothetical protein
MPDLNLPRGCLRFQDVHFGEMAYVYPDTPHWTAGWLLRRTEGGVWETLRKATTEDLQAITSEGVRSFRA